MWANIIPIPPDRSCLDNRGMISKVVKLKMQCFYTCICTLYKLHDKETQKCMQHAMIQKYILTPNLGFLPQIHTDVLWAHLARIITRSQGHSDLETVGDLPGPKMYLYSKYGTATINNIGDLLLVHFSRTES